MSHILKIPSTPLILKASFVPLCTTINYFNHRWYRALNALKAMHTMQKLTFPETVPGKFNKNN